jgi:hypothetical protein
MAHFYWCETPQVYHSGVLLHFGSLLAACALCHSNLMFWTKTIVVLGLTAFFAQSGDMPPVPVARQTEEFALKARREGQPGLQIPIPPDRFAKVTETISVYPTVCDEAISI